MICYPIFFLIIEDKTYLFEKKKKLLWPGFELNSPFGETCP